MSRHNLRSLWIALAVAVSVASPAFAEDAPFYRGKTITIAVGTSAGGGYDTYARLLSRHLGKHLPGRPTVIVTNMPGAGSNIAAAYAARIAPKDGTAIAATFAAQPLTAVLEDVSDLKFDPSKMNYLGTPASDVFLCMVRAEAPVKTFDDVYKQEVIVGGTADTGSTGYIPVMLNNLLGTRFKVVVGYPGTREIMAAMERGETHGMCGMNWTTVVSQYSHWLKNNQMRILVQESFTGQPEMNQMGIPLLTRYVKTDEQRRILEIVYSQQIFARPYFVAAEVPPERVQQLRKAFMDAWRDPELLSEAAKLNYDISPMSGEEVQDVLRKVYANPPDILRKAKESIKAKR